MKFRRFDMKGVALIAAGFVLVALVAGGYAIGAAIDRHFDAGPRWAVVGLIAGFIIGFWDLYVIATRLMAAQPPVRTMIPPEAWEEAEEAEKTEND